MDSDKILALVTLTVAFISLIGTSLQYVLPVKKPVSDKEFDMAKTLESITEAYDKLFKQLNDRIDVLEGEALENKKQILELTTLRITLEKRVIEQEREIESLKNTLNTINLVNKVTK